MAPPGGLRAFSMIILPSKGNTWQYNWLPCGSASAPWSLVCNTVEWFTQIPIDTVNINVLHITLNTGNWGYDHVKFIYNNVAYYYYPATNSYNNNYIRDTVIQAVVGPVLRQAWASYTSTY